MTDLGRFVSYIEIDDDTCHVKSCFSNQLIKINEFFLSLELCLRYLFVILSQS